MVSNPNRLDAMEINEGQGDSIENELDVPVLNSTLENKNNQVEFHFSSVSGLNECLTDKARHLCIMDLFLKLSQSDHYDIGGTYSKYTSHKKADLWFYCTTCMGPNANYILNIFVCHRNTGSFAIGISNTNNLKKNKISASDSILPYLTLSNTLSWKTYKSFEIDESHHIKSFCFSKEDMLLLNKTTLCIPIEIDIYPVCTLDKEIIWRIKRNHKLLSLFKRQEKTDFILESITGTRYGTHKLLIATHSSVLRDIMKNSKDDLLVVNISDDTMEKFLEYLYSGYVRNIFEYNCCELLDIAGKFKLENLIKEIENALIQQISVNNAIDIAALSEKYKLDRIQKSAFKFIKNNPEILESDGWKNLNDVALTKKLFKEIYSVKNCN